VIAWITGLGLFLVGVIVGAVVASHLAGRALGRLLVEFGVSEEQLERKARELDGDTVPDTAQQHTVWVKVEHADHSYFAYLVGSSEFLAKAATPDELLDRLETQFPQPVRIRIASSRNSGYFQELADQHAAES